MAPPIEPAPTSVDPSLPDLDIPIALRKDKRFTAVYPISHFVSYDRLYPSFRNFTLSISSESVPRNYQEALHIPHWKATTNEKMQASTSHGTWELVTMRKHSLLWLD